MLIEIGENGEIGVDGQPVDIRNLRAFIERADVDRAGDAALIMTHRNVSPRVIVQVVDAIKHAGIAEITFAADRRLNGS